MGRRFTYDLIRIAKYQQRAARRHATAQQRIANQQWRVQQQTERQAMAEQRAAEQHANAQRKEYERQQKARQKELEQAIKRNHLENQNKQAQQLTAESQSLLSRIDSVITASNVSAQTDIFAGLYPDDTFPPFAPPALEAPPVYTPLSREFFFQGIRTHPSFIESLFRASKAERLASLQQAEANYAAALSTYDTSFKAAVALVESRKIVNAYGMIAVEDVQVNRMTHNHCLAKSIQDAVWSGFFDKLFSKAEEAGRTAIKVNPAYTSQDCNRCHHRQKMPLSERMYQCPCCLLSIDRDLNASLNILSVGRHTLGFAEEAPAF